MWLRSVPLIGFCGSVDAVFQVMATTASSLLGPGQASGRPQSPQGSVDRDLIEVTFANGPSRDGIGPGRYRRPWIHGIGRRLTS